MIDLKKLNEIKIEDLKNVDYKALLENLKKQPDKIILAAIVAVTVIFLFSYISKRPKTIQQLNIKIHALEDKIKTIKAYEAQKEELDAFLEDIPPGITTDALRKLLNDLAVKNDVYIDGFSPAQREEKELHETINFQLNLSANDYRHLVLFVRDLENMPFGIRVDSWKGNLSQRVAAPAAQRRNETQQPPKLSVIVHVTAVNLKNENTKK